MDNNELLQNILKEFLQEIMEFNDGVPRQAHFSSMPKKIKVAIGMRRVGKTYFLMQKIKSLVDEGVPLSRILYMNFEDDRLLPVSQKKLRELIDQFYSLYPENHEAVCYLFLDEIQNVEYWSY